MATNDNRGQTLIINGHNYTKYVKARGGLKWARNDVDSKKSVRVVAGANMRRDKLGTKRTMTWDLLRMPEADFAQLDTDVSDTFYTATIRDPHGQSSITAYTSKVEGTLVLDEDENRFWEDISFEMAEQ